MEKLIIQGIEIILFDAEKNASMPINWLAMSREPNTHMTSPPSEYEYYIKEFVIGDQGWPNDSIFWEETILFQQSN